MFSGKKILITGGAGTLGKEIIRRAHEKKSGSQITILSRDVFKHHAVKRVYPYVQSIVGDIGDAVTVYNAMAGKDIVIHAAATKVIPDSEWNSFDTIEVNVMGSLNVLQAAAYHSTPQVIGISTDKACHPANAYGSTKHLMEKLFQEFSRYGYPTRFGLVRYGNVLESNGSVIEAWKRLLSAGHPIRITDPSMTRFWISPKQAVQIILDSIEGNVPSGRVLIPKMKSLSVGKLAEYTLDGGYESETIPLRPGEKLHETLLTVEECDYAEQTDDYFVLRPMTEGMVDEPVFAPYTSDTSPELTKDELMELLKNE
jgi:UDP-N-acetylglucosamine 4,6-dehydratase/5-epimerase